MQIKAERKTKPVTHAPALAALWRVKLRLGQCPVRIQLAERECPPTCEKQRGRI